MPALPEVGQYKQEELDALEQWAGEVGIGMDELADKILRLAERAVERRSAARLAADKAAFRSRTQAENVISIFPDR